jgi:hypothetical protein
MVAAQALLMNVISPKCHKVILAPTHTLVNPQSVPAGLVYYVQQRLPRNVLL